MKNVLRIQSYESQRLSRQFHKKDTVVVVAVLCFFRTHQRVGRTSDQEKKMMTHTPLFVLRGFPLLLWMGVIFSFSSLHGSAYPFDPTLAYYVERKSAHLVEYAVLTVLAVRFLYAIFLRETFSKILLLATVFSITYGASDELHQFFVPYRGAKMSDVFIDSIGVLFIAGIYYVLYRKKKGKKA
ncbi:MAG: hypothetical protein COZ29_01020 [Candidatus Moranbacteria bacterium CG_4_10_14_3_um_filter_45_9]|nr:MAG: hypothetical protein COZ29_01020 [Candidatus Moranbacteria bacterium CG_4_10_14_3_um_filter_45_9]